MDKMKIIPIFVPHIGCPNDCVFCNQKKITGKGTVVASAGYAEGIVEEYIKTIDKDTFTEIAFFGGSFTAINKEVQKQLLGVAKHYKDEGTVQRIRMSTRPDAISEEILDIQKSYGVDIIELGIQCLDDDVLKKSNRGHSKSDSINASRLIRKYGFTLGHQIMPGLPGSTREIDLKTCLESISMMPDIVRIYPTLVIKDTELENMYLRGEYKPLSVDKAVEISSLICSEYMVNNINVIRTGLQNTETINKDGDVVAGPFHPAFGQLVDSNIYFASLVNTLKYKSLSGSNIKISSPNSLISTLAGQNKINVIKLKEMFNIKKISFENSINAEEIEIYDEEKSVGIFSILDVYKNYLKYNGGQYVFKENLRQWI